jgi:DNA-binding transcriptional MerR regulator
LRLPYIIGEAAERLGLTAPTLRYYDKEGLLPYVDRSASGIRMFKEADFEWLRLIECLKATGMPIRDIRRFIDWNMQGDSTLGLRRDMFHERKRIVEAQIETMKKTLDMIEYKCWYYDVAAEAGTCDAVKNMKPGRFRSRFRN